MTRLQLTHAEWKFIGPCLPIGKYGPYPERLRQQFEGVIWRFRTGGQRREMPQEFGSWSTVHNRFRQSREAAFLGRSLGGQASKVHLAADRRCRPLAFVLTAGQAADSPPVIPVLGKIRVRGPVGRPALLDEWAYQRPYRSRP